MKKKEECNHFYLEPSKFGCIDCEDTAQLCNCYDCNGVFCPECKDIVWMDCEEIKERFYKFKKMVNK